MERTSTGSTLSTRGSRLAAYLAAAVVVLLSLFAYGLKLVEPRIRELEGRIDRIDVPARRATLELRHPRSGALIRASGVVEPDCVIEIDGRRAELADLHAGDRVRVTVEFHPISNKAVVRRAVRLEPERSAEYSP